MRKELKFEEKPESIAERFVKNEKPFKVRGYISDGSRLVFQTLRTRRIRIKGPKHKAWLQENAARGFISILSMWSDSAEVRGVEENTIAVKLPTASGTVILGNSSVLPLVNRRMVYGKEKLNWEETEIQRALATRIPMIPFSVLEQARLDVRKIRIVERGPEETVKRWETRYDSKQKKEVKELMPRHFTGASLFEIEGKYFLFDLDRRELEHGIFNPFLAELPTGVNSIVEAYSVLKPDEVMEAERKGLKVKRQGEWFFIPCTTKKELNAEPDMTERGTWDDEKTWKPRPKRIELKAGPNRPNHATEGIEKLSLVRGTVTHAGREHAPLKLACYHKAVPNTAIKSFTITGDID